LGQDHLRIAMCIGLKTPNRIKVRNQVLKEMHKINPRDPTHLIALNRRSGEETYQLKALRQLLNLL
jgi:hypothetical protein